MFVVHRYFVMVSLAAGASLNINNIFKQVSNKFPLSNLTSCLLDQINIGNVYRPKVPCITACSTNPSCYLACYDDSVCNLYSATLSVYYTGNQSQYQPTTEFNNTFCYSSFYDSNDITSKIVATSVSSSSSSKYDKSLAIDGYYCLASSLVSLFTSNSSQTGQRWLIADLGKPYKVTKVVVQTTSKCIIQFIGIEVRIGNQNSSGNSLWVPYPGPATCGSVVILQGSGPVRGRYVSLTILNGHLYLPEVKIIGKL